jgi:hypothetical protein
VQCACCDATARKTIVRKQWYRVGKISDRWMCPNCAKEIKRA